MKYVYYDPASMQVMAEFNTPYLSEQANWAAKGYLRAIVPEGLTVTRDHRIQELDLEDETIARVLPSVNPEQPKPRERTPLDDLHDKLGDDTISDVEIREMLRLERGR